MSDKLLFLLDDQISELRIQNEQLLNKQKQLEEKLLEYEQHLNDVCSKIELNVVSPLRTSGENRVLKAARRYGRLKAFGCIVNESDNEITIPGYGNTISKLELYSSFFLESAVDLIRDMSIDGKDGQLIE